MINEQTIITFINSDTEVFRMHRGDEVFITKSGKYYHYFDDDCPTTSSILKGK
ncbi:hypothetical protein [Bacillus suaedaesalsae]|uniref:Uncharacterized protein n=1 Tax=Bacillus suaedaesalsae TaxID=2810349 RepID=A0ABS2DJT2_9BACI|nr:hypothetical protein [Bacillus suaedaesalsae]MBM6618752.1 hypothetical protein [Bacillus suaedaesalsae]